MAQVEEQAEEPEESCNAREMPERWQNSGLQVGEGNLLVSGPAIVEGVWLRSVDTLPDGVAVRYRLFSSFSEDCEYIAGTDEWILGDLRGSFIQEVSTTIALTRGEDLCVESLEESSPGVIEANYFDLFADDL